MAAKEKKKKRQPGERKYVYMAKVRGEYRCMLCVRV